MSMRQMVRKGRASLRVVGSQKTGFRLSAQDKAGIMYPFSDTFQKQTEAVSFGESKFGQKAIKKMMVKTS